MSELLDNLDIRILSLLQTDVSLPVTEIAEQLGSSKSVVWRRIQRMLESGLIRERVAILDPKKLGLGMIVFSHVKMSKHGRGALPRFIEAIKGFPQVVECHTLMGDVDFLLKIVVRDIAEYEDFFWHELSQIDGVREVSSSISMSQVVSTTRLPLQPRRPAGAAQRPGGPA